MKIEPNSQIPVYAVYALRTEREAGHEATRFRNSLRREGPPISTGAFATGNRTSHMEGDHSWRCHVV